MHTGFSFRSGQPIRQWWRLTRGLNGLYLLALLAIVVAGCVPVQPVEPAADMDAAPSSNVIQATFVCPDGTELPTVFDNDADTVTVGLPDGEVTLPRAISASGARYANEDESIVFWNKGDEAMVQVNGDIVYQGCVAQ
jgi:membrane-bound inhibitor of C-type lysozyme